MPIESSRKPEPVASVVLCVRNGESTLPGQLAALDAQDDAPRWEAVLVDNASCDGTRALLDEFAARHHDARVITETRVGLNFARNAGIAAARGSKILLCDADDEVSPQWLRSLAAALDRADVVGGALEIVRLNPPPHRPEWQNQTGALPESLGRPYAVGANLGFKRSVWESVGGFDARFAGGSDDTDFCLRAQDAGYTIAFEPTAVVHYRLRARLGRIARQHYGYGRGEERMIAKRGRLGLVDGRPRARWRCLATETVRDLRSLPANLASPDGRRRCVERVAFQLGRLVELSLLSARRTRARQRIA
ncbi:MAG TPA: glycosyltransferase [Acidimicrobiia bacterium]|nr:glycosyltransferase [Acidimicrobiia bacterium]